MNKVLKSLIVLFALISLVGCSKAEKYEFDQANVLSRDDSMKVFQEVENCKGKSVTL